MTTLLHGLFWNAVEATILAIVVAIVVRLTRPRSTICHALWLLVLLRLVVPPTSVHSFGLSALRMQLVQRISELASASADTGAMRLAVQPDSGATELGGSTESTDAVSGAIGSVQLGEPDEFQPSGEPFLEQIDSAVPMDLAGGSLFLQAAEPDMAGSTGRDASPNQTAASWLTPAVLLQSLTAFWLAGSICVFGIRVKQWAAMLRLLRGGTQAPAAVIQACNELTARLGLRRTPEIRVIDRLVSPTLCALGRTVIVLPRRLVDGSRPEVIRNVIAHELSHLRRRDHWVCWLELVTSLVYWWNPTFWWTRRELRRAADELADAWAVALLGQRQAYAQSLLETVELLVADRTVAAVWGPALGERDTIARRLTMIMKGPLFHRLSWPARLGFGALGLLVLPGASQAPVAQEAKELPAPTAVSTPPSTEELSGLLELLVQDAPGEPQRRRPQPPQPPGAPDGPRAPERPGRMVQQEPPGRPERGNPEQRLSELEQKVDRILQMLQAMHPGQPGGPPSGMPGMAAGATTPPGVPAGVPGIPGAVPAPPAGPGGPAGFGAMGGMPQMPGGMMMGPGGRGGVGFGGGGAFGGPATPGQPPAAGGGGGFGRTGGFMMRTPGQGPDRPGIRGNPNLSPESRERFEALQREIAEEMKKIDEEQARVMEEFQKRREAVERKQAAMSREFLGGEARERDRRGGEGDRPRGGVERRRGPDGPRGDGDRPREGAEEPGERAGARP